MGRRQELYLLREAWAGAVAARCEFVFVSGPAGSGKSRLAAATAAVAEAAGGVTLRARCNEAERSLFLQPIVEAVRGHLETVSAEVAAELVGSWAGTLAELLPGLTVPLGTGAVPYDRAGPELEHRRSLEAVTEFVARLAQRQPVLLLLEDLEHAGASTLEALRFMAGRLGHERLLVVVTLRPEEAREAMETLEHLGREIRLGPLPQAAVVQLAAAMGVPELAGPVYGLTGGDVLFSVEAFRLAADSDRAADALEVSRSLRDVVTERVRRAGADVEEFLRVAVVAGASFDLDLVAAVQDVAPEAAARLAQRALEAGLLTTKADDLAFANSVIQSVLYETTPPAVRASRHRRIAELVADRPELVAVHREAAGDWQRAYSAWTEAAADARRRFANRDAERLFGRALAAAVAAGDDAAVGRVSLRRGQIREELADYAGARRRPPAGAGAGPGPGRFGAGGHGPGAARVDRLLRARRRPGGRLRGAGDGAGGGGGGRARGPGVSALVLVGRVRHWAGDMAGASAAYEQALVDGESEPATVASALSCLGALLEHGDRFAEARDVLARAMATCEETGSFRALLRTLFFAGLARANLGDLVGALRVLERKRGLLNRYDVQFYRARTSTTLSWVWRELGDVGPGRGPGPGGDRAVAGGGRGVAADGAGAARPAGRGRVPAAGGRRGGGGGAGGGGRAVDPGVAALPLAGRAAPDRSGQPAGAGPGRAVARSGPATGLGQVPGPGPGPPGPSGGGGGGGRADRFGAACWPRSPPTARPGTRCNRWPRPSPATCARDSPPTAA